VSAGLEKTSPQIRRLFKVFEIRDSVRVACFGGSHPWITWLFAVAPEALGRKEMRNTARWSERPAKAVALT